MSSGPVEAFRTHSNYIRAFACIAGWRTPDADSVYVLAGIASKVKSTSRFTSTQRRACDPGAVRSSLSNAWGTEALLGMAGVYGLSDEMIRLSNNWAVVQLYYAVYHAAHALMQAQAGQPPTTHEATAKRFLDLWVKPQEPEAVMPLSLAYGGFGPVNAPSDIQPDDGIPNWTSCDGMTCWSLALKALRTTRSEQLQVRFAKRRKEKLSERKKQWKKDEAARLASGKSPRKTPTWSRPNLTAAERNDVARKLRDHSLIDYLYRLRTRSNYEDVSMFSEGPEDDEVSARVHGDLTRLAAACLLVHELYIAQCVGFDRLRGWADDWISTYPLAPVSPSLAARRRLL